MNMRWMRAGLAISGLVAVLAGCGGARDSATNSASDGKLRVTFWHTRRGSQEAALKRVCADFNQQNPDLEVVPEYQGNYDDLLKKIRGAAQAKSLPALTVAYESHVTEYMKNGLVRELDSLVQDPQQGFMPEELADIPEAYLESNRFSQFNNQLLSFPFTKSNLVLYYNLDLLRKAGFQAAPQTWSEFEQQAAAVSKLTGKPAFVYTPDASTLDGLIYSFGGSVINENQTATLFDQPATIRAFELLQRMTRAKTLLEAPQEDAAGLFTSQLCAFVLNSSSHRAMMEEQIKDAFQWDLAVIPHAEGVSPVTVMYGPNVCLFKTNPETEAAAWRFVKYFVSPEVTARWARETGYLPVRKSAVELPEMKEFYAQNPRARHVYEVLQHAKGEPNVLGWQEVRAELERTASNVIAMGTSPAEAAVQLKRTADRILVESR